MKKDYQTAAAAGGCPVRRGTWVGLVVSLCDVCGVVDGLGLQGVGEGRELPEAFDSPVLAFGGEQAGGGPTQPHVGTVPVAL